MGGLVDLEMTVNSRNIRHKGVGGRHFRAILIPQCIQDITVCSVRIFVADSNIASKGQLLGRRCRKHQLKATIAVALIPFRRIAVCTPSNEARIHAGNLGHVPKAVNIIQSGSIAPASTIEHLCIGIYVEYKHIFSLLGFDFESVIRFAVNAICRQGPNAIFAYNRHIVRENASAKDCKVGQRVFCIIGKLVAKFRSRSGFVNPEAHRVSRQPEAIVRNFMTQGVVAECLIDHQRCMV